MVHPTLVKPSGLFGSGDWSSMTRFAC